LFSTPYPKAMNANNDVDQAAAVIICAARVADALGIPRDRWVFPHAGTGAHDHDLVSYRANLHSSPAMRIAGRRAMELAGLGPDDMHTVDLYSCFPSAVQVAADEIGFGLDRELTVTGGLTFAGGPWNDYVMHAIATTVTRLREEPGAFGFIGANGGFLTKHAFGVYSTEPPAKGFRHDEPQDAVDALERRDVVPAQDAVDEATIESYTVAYDRDGNPGTAIAALRTGDGRRAWASSADDGVPAAMLTGEWVGRRARRGASGPLEPL
jgi:acetyl-CoA C-acetyltransferase